MQSDRSQNANDVHVEVHRPRKERRKNGVTVLLMGKVTEQATKYHVKNLNVGYFEMYERKGEFCG